MMEYQNRTQKTHEIENRIEKNNFNFKHRKNVKNLSNTMNLINTSQSKHIFENINPRKVIAELAEFNNTNIMDELAKDFNTLYLSNDSDFSVKPKTIPSPMKQKIKTNGIVNVHNDRGDSIVQQKDASCNILKINIVSSKTDTKKMQPITDETQEVITDDCVENNEESVNDLQSLLIMMALSTKDDDGSENCKSESSDTIHKTNEIRNNGSEIVECSRTVSISNLTKIIDNVDFFTIKQLKSKQNARKESIAKKYVMKWKAYVNNRKKHVSDERQDTLNKFISALENKKKKLTQPNDSAKKAKMKVNDYNTYQHRYKMQRHIIALQKAKLEEQTRIIDELRYNKIIEASSQSVDALREEVRKTYYEVDRHLKPKIKCITNELKIEEIQEPALILHCLKMPQFLQRMEKRAREREEKHAMIRERRKQMEEERLRLKQQAEIEKAQMDNAEKIRRLKEMKEKRKLEKIENIRKKQMAERMRALTVMADLHYERTLKIKYGIKPLKILLRMKQQNIERANAHYWFQLKKNVFLRWMFHTEDMCYERNYVADDFYRKKILRIVFDALKQNHREYVLKLQVAEDYNDLYITQLVFKKFRQAIEVVRKENEIKWNRVVHYHNSIILFRTFTCWRTLPALNALQREQEARKARWRQRVLQVVPDYTPRKTENLEENLDLEILNKSN